jgi:lipopolysaccharide/colanic/teichoic acid biosynthesis glycosyltransferase
MLKAENFLHLQASSSDISLRDGIRRTSVYPLIKRAMDVVGASVIGLLILPLLCILAVIIRRDGGKAFYCQRRLGENGRIFSIWKLRSMVPNADLCLQRYLEENPEARVEWDLVQKLRNDPRITPIGRYLRKYSIDEFPQLLNVFTGDMSLVGPRPMFPEQRALYPGTAYFHLRPGMTGLWQVSERNGSSFADRAKFDTLYAETMSLRTDLTTLLRTVAVVFRGTGC